MIYLKDHKQIIRKKDAKGGSLAKLYKSFSPKEILSIPTFSMEAAPPVDFKTSNPEYETGRRDLQCLGSSECTKKEGNTRPDHAEGRVGVKESAEGAIPNALQRNCRFGFVAGGLDDRGIYGSFYDSDRPNILPV